jgi:hypothetical protein
MKLLTIVLFTMFPYIVGTTKSEKITILIEPQKTTLVVKQENIEEKKDVTKIEKKEFFDKIAYMESRGKYNVSNKYLMLGKYQASYSSLKEFGYSKEKILKIRKSIYSEKNSNGVSLYYFDEQLFPSHEQERFIEYYFDKIENVYMKKYIQNYVGKTIDGVYVSKAGILCASTLGLNHVKDFLKSDGKINFSDRFGTSVKEKLKQMQKIEIK